jgi:hypothetical protein
MLTLLLALGLSSEPALVELFSSEGCSSCPPAESLWRTRAAADPSLVVLEFHVDYWNSLGWTDAFSSAAFSAHQDRYAGWRGTQLFTPQAMVDGQYSFIGSDAERADDAIRRARTSSKQPLIVEVRGSKVSISSPAAPAGELWVAVTEAGLESMVTRGENQGRTLKHAPVVRDFRQLGAIARGPLTRETSLVLAAGWRAENLRVVAAVQDAGSGHILALGAAKERDR